MLIVIEYVKENYYARYHNPYLATCILSTEKHTLVFYSM